MKLCEKHARAADAGIKAALEIAKAEPLTGESFEQWDARIRQAMEDAWNKAMAEEEA